MRFASLVATFALAFLMAPGSADASEWNKKTRLDVDETIRVPGATLPPGEYVVKLADSPSNRHIVRFMNSDETEVLATVLAIPNQRMQPTGKTQLGFYETPAGTPPAIRSWFYPGDTFGQEFVYSKREAAEIAPMAKRNVPTMDDSEAGKLSGKVTNPNEEPPLVVVRETRIYRLDPKGGEVASDEGSTMNEKADREPTWQKNQERYGSYGRFSDTPTKSRKQ